jgi:transcriptional regulator with GAF, ATPase, and Fis domain
MSNVQVRLQRLERILEISRELTSTVSLEPLLHQIVKVAAELSGSQAASILLLDTRTGELRFRAADDDPAPSLPGRGEADWS